MATQIGALNVKLTAGIGGFARGMSQSGSYVDSLQSKVGGLTSKIGKLAVAGGALLGAGGLAAGLGTGVKLAADYEQAQVAMTTMIGSASKAEAVLSDLNDFAASTPFEMPGLTTATKKLLAFGSTPEAVIGELRMLGDIAAGIGQPVDQLAELYGKARVSGRLFAEDINQLTGRGIPIIAALAKQFGVADSEVKSLVQSGAVNFGHVARLYLNGYGSNGEPTYHFTYDPPPPYEYLRPHDHRDNHHGGYAFAVYHPGSATPQQPWAI